MAITDNYRQTVGECSAVQCKLGCVERFVNNRQLGHAYLTCKTNTVNLSRTIQTRPTNDDDDRQGGEVGILAVVHARVAETEVEGEGETFPSATVD